MTKEYQQNTNKRTAQQNRALHEYFKLLAETLNEAGLDQRVVLKPNIPIDWTPQDIKDKIWRPVQKAYIKEHSTTQLSTKDINKIFDFIHRHLTTEFGEFAQFPLFPSIEELMFQQEYGNKVQNIRP